MYEQGNSFAEGYMIGRDANNGGFGWGNDSAWWIIILLIFGWGGNNGFGGGFGGNNNMAFDLGRLATTNDVASGFSTSEIMSDLNDILLQNSQNTASLQQTLCQGFNGINTALLQGFHGVDNAVCTLGYQNQQGFNSLSRELGDCCCKLERGIDSINFNTQRNTCDIIQANNANTQRLVDLINSNETQKLRDENFALKLGASQEKQNNYLVNTLRPVAQPAYITCSPYESAFGYPRNTYGCGCNSCAVVQ